MDTETDPGAHHPLRLWRRGRGVSTRQLADRLTKAGHPITHVSIARMERGEQPMTLDLARAIALATDGKVRPDHLCGVAPYGDGAEVAP